MCRRRCRPLVRQPRPRGLTPSKAWLAAPGGRASPPGRVDTWPGRLGARAGPLRWWAVLGLGLRLPTPPCRTGPTAPGRCDTLEGAPGSPPRLRIHPQDTHAPPAAALPPPLAARPGAHPLRRRQVRVSALAGEGSRPELRDAGVRVWRRRACGADQGSLQEQTSHLELARAVRAPGDPGQALTFLGGAARPHAGQHCLPRPPRGHGRGAASCAHPHPQPQRREDGEPRSRLAEPAGPTWSPLHRRWGGVEGDAWEAPDHPL